MTLYTKTLHHFVDLEQIVRDETWKIFHPILVEVERQGEEVLLFPPVRGTLWVEWLVKPPEGIPTEFYRHLLLMVQLARFSELNLVLVERYEGKPDDLDREIFTEHYRAGRIPRDWQPRFNVMQREANEEEAAPLFRLWPGRIGQVPLKGKK